MPSRERVNAFVATVRAGRYVEAIADFYADEATMRENLGPERAGRDALIAHEKAMLGSMRRIDTTRADPVMVDGDKVVVGWTFEFTGQDGAVRRMSELALQTWRGERIVKEQFFYDPGQMATAVEAEATLADTG
ncbi:MAG TPA: nuclear transport factor 2 family protein [Caulobacteraceae bacterium]|jgi:ketosteroid isomerase-like protein